VTVIARSAHGHNVADEDMLHAFAHPVRVFYGEEGFTMLVGPDRAGNLLEVGVVEGDFGLMIVHAMKARPKYLR